MLQLNEFASLWRNKRGTTSIEYAILACLISVMLVGSATAVGVPLRATFDKLAIAFSGSGADVSGRADERTGSVTSSGANGSETSGGSTSSCTVAHANCGNGNGSNGNGPIHGKGNG